MNSTNSTGALPTDGGDKAPRFPFGCTDRECIVFALAIVILVLLSILVTVAVCVLMRLGHKIRIGTAALAAASSENSGDVPARVHTARTGSIIAHIAKQKKKKNKQKNDYNKVDAVI